MEQSTEEFKIKIGKNISEYRRLANLSQVEFAEKLNYSDKAVSKWERGESLPDIIVLKEISDLFQITVNDLISNKDVKRKRIDLKKLMQNKKTVLGLSVGLVWLVATVFFVLFQVLDIFHTYNWLPFVYAIPISSIICIVFYAKYKRTLGLVISESVLIWSCAISLCLSVNYDRIWFLLIIAIPLQLLILMWNYFRKKRKLQ